MQGGGRKCLIKVESSKMKTYFITFTAYQAKQAIKTFTIITGDTWLALFYNSSFNSHVTFMFPVGIF